MKRSSLDSPRSEKDGQEFGLVPKYVLRKKKAVSTKGIDSENAFQNGPMMKDLTEEENPYKTVEEVNKLLHETNSLLSRRWGLSSLIESEHDKKVLLATEAYQPPKAANRIEKNCNTKMELFGAELIDKKITLFEDLVSKKTEIGVEDGYVQLLPTRDLSER